MQIPSDVKEAKLWKTLHVVNRSCWLVFPPRKAPFICRLRHILHTASTTQFISIQNTVFTLTGQSEEFANTNTQTFNLHTWKQSKNIRKGWNKRIKTKTTVCLLVFTQSKPAILDSKVLLVSAWKSFQRLRLHLVRGRHVELLMIWSASLKTCSVLKCEIALCCASDFRGDVNNPSATFISVLIHQDLMVTDRSSRASVSFLHAVVRLKTDSVVYVLSLRACSLLLSCLCRRFVVFLC